MRNTLFAILLVMNSTAWAVTYQPYVNPMKTTVPKSTQVQYDMPDFRFYSTSIYQSNHGYGTSRIAQHGEVKATATGEQIGLQQTRAAVGNGFNILGNARERKPMTPQMWILDGVSMSSTSTMINSTRNNRQDPTQVNARINATPLRVPGKPGTPDEGDPENQQPLGDGLWPLLLMALAYCVARVVKSERMKELTNERMKE